MDEVLRNAGWIEVICGSMFSGKTEELLRRMKRAEIARQRTVIFKPLMDTRFSDEEVVSHSNLRSPSIPIEDPGEILSYAKDYDVIGIDEGQFFSELLVEVCDRLADQGKRVIVAGLDQDYQKQPFGPIPALLAKAEYITKTHAICVVCGNPANHSFRKIKKVSQIMLGGEAEYEPRCRTCFNLGNNVSAQKTENEDDL
jgi:thymidine kinase